MNNNVKSFEEIVRQFEQAFPGLGQSLHVVMACAAATCLIRKVPLSLILVGNPSMGKSTVLSVLNKPNSLQNLKDNVLRVDDFTAASLVSHATNVKKGELKDIDLLPQMKDKIVVTKEMSPVFTGSEDELTKKFSIFARVLDGEGYLSYSATHGKRGYDEEMQFTLMGAVTPRVMSQKVYSTLTAVGPRFCFWEIQDRPIDKAWTGPNSLKEKMKEDALHNASLYLDEFFSKNVVNSIQPSSISFSEDLRFRLSRIASLMAALRSEIYYEKDSGSGSSMAFKSEESPERAYRYLEQIALGSALIAGRNEVRCADLYFALQVAISSGNSIRRQAIRIFMECVRLDAKSLAEKLNVTSDTALKHARTFVSLGLLEVEEISGTNYFRLAKEFEILRNTKYEILVSEKTDVDKKVDNLTENTNSSIEAPRRVSSFRKYSKVNEV